MTSNYTAAMMANPMAEDVKYLVRRVEERDERIAELEAQIEKARVQVGHAAGRLAHVNEADAKQAWLWVVKARATLEPM